MKRSFSRSILKKVVEAYFTNFAESLVFHLLSFIVSFRAHNVIEIPLLLNIQIDKCFNVCFSSLFKNFEFFLLARALVMCLYFIAG